MDENRRSESPHVLVLTYPTTGHINPMLQFAKRLRSKGLMLTLAVTKYIRSSVAEAQTGSIAVETFSDGFDQGGFLQADNLDLYHKGLEEMGSKTLAELIQKYQMSSDPIIWLLYDAILPWAIPVARRFGVKTAAFFTQSCCVDAIYLHVQRGNLSIPVVSGMSVSLPALPQLNAMDLPSFISNLHYPVFRGLLVNQFNDLGQSDWVFCNTFEELESEIARWMLEAVGMRAIGPTLPSKYLDNRVEADSDYGLSLWNTNGGLCKEWLDNKADGSVVYVSFGSAVKLLEEQMEELASGLLKSDHYFLWVVRASEEGKLPSNFAEEAKYKKGLVVQWCPQLDVLAHPAVGVFVTHSGWNSTLEGLSLGVPMVAVPQWTDQPTNAKCVEDVWRVGLRVRVDGGKEGFSGDEIARCIKEVLEGESGGEMRRNASKWKKLAKQAVDEGGRSDKNIDEFVAAVKT